MPSIYCPFCFWLINFDSRLCTIINITCIIDLWKLKRELKQKDGYEHGQSVLYVSKLLSKNLNQNKSMWFMKRNIKMGIYICMLLYMIFLNKYYLCFQIKIHSLIKKNNHSFLFFGKISKLLKLSFCKTFRKFQYI